MRNHGGLPLQEAILGLKVKTHKTIGEAVTQLKSSGMQILATHLSDKSRRFPWR
ncbi:tRNA (guanosine(18)-2'-O)-methyltransferase [Cedecea neteri]|uniref:tRNA (Guanosine(18)-2'-O)-methyltransferase n=1 Tax=Cedecea neteri TaxID=158822 RepID=A0A2X2SZ70_9ENTR|nr:tRNA (guanosine(18)-2'-O)-methyltransferase [Cedecea neteri]